jgi:hypothetical protein
VQLPNLKIDVCLLFPCRKAGTSLDHRTAVAALRALASVRLPFPATASAEGRDPAALLVAAITPEDSSDGLDTRLSAAAVTAVAALSVPPDHCYGYGELASFCTSWHGTAPRTCA